VARNVMDLKRKSQSSVVSQNFQDFFPLESIAMILPANLFLREINVSYMNRGPNSLRLSRREVTNGV